LVKFADSSNQPAQIRAATLHAACYPACYLRAA